MKAILSIAAILGIATAGMASAQVETGNLPEWLAGHWCSEEGPRGQTCETWQRPTGGMMLGTSQTVKQQRTVAFEFLRITEDGEGLVYLPQPGGRSPVAFRGQAGGPGVTFVNTGHDYPQRIHYRREGDALIAEISLADGSKPMRWAYRRRD